MVSEAEVLAQVYCIFSLNSTGNLPKWPRRRSNSVISVRVPVMRRTISSNTQRRIQTDILAQVDAELGIYTRSELC